VHEAVAWLPVEFLAMGKYIKVMLRLIQMKEQWNIDGSANLA
jgi:hypothetical protein